MPSTATILVRDTIAHPDYCNSLQFMPSPLSLSSTFICMATTQNLTFKWVNILKYVRVYCFSSKNLPKVPITLKAKAKVLTMACKALHDWHPLLLLCSHLLSVSPHLLHSNHTDLLEQAKNILASRPLHLPFCLLGTVFPFLCSWITLLLPSNLFSKVTFWMSLFLTSL